MREAEATNIAQVSETLYNDKIRNLGVCNCSRRSLWPVAHPCLLISWLLHSYSSCALPASPYTVLLCLEPQEAAQGNLEYVDVNI